MAEQENKSFPCFWLFALIGILTMFSIANPESSSSTATSFKLTSTGGTIGKEYPVTEKEYILLCNLLSREYGSDSVPVPEKARVVQTVMNRVHSPNFPNDIESVISAPNQFDGYVPGYEYAPGVTSSVKDAVQYCLDGKCHDTALYFWGDGMKNHFFNDYASWENSFYSRYN